MKKTLKTALILTVSVFFGGTALAQQMKIGHINSQELIQSMPQTDSVGAQIEAFAKELSEQLEAIEVEINNKIATYQKEVSTYSDAIRQMKEKEINDLNTRYQENTQIAQQELQQVQYDLMAPIFNMADEAIKETARANGISIVLDTAQGSVLYTDDNTVDLLPLVKNRMGIQ